MLSQYKRSSPFVVTDDVRHLQTQPGLATTTRAGQCHKPHIRLQQETLYSQHFLFTPNKRGERYREMG